jgi:hypothetical protein
VTPPHLPVLLEPVLELLSPRPGMRIVDATVGGGGHAEAIARRLAGEGELIAIDRDPEMLECAGKRLAPFGSSVRLVHARISHLHEVLGGVELEAVDGILLDLGLCSLQLDDPERGFRFQPAGRPVPLDMRMDRSRGKTAAALDPRPLLERFGPACPSRTPGSSWRRLARCLCRSEATTRQRWSSRRSASQSTTSTANSRPGWRRRWSCSSRAAASRC